MNIKGSPDGWTTGDAASVTRVIDDGTVRQYADISLDYNGIHLNDDDAAESIFGRRIAHGQITAGLFSGLLGTKSPGKGTLYLEQNTRFLRPVYIGDEVTATVILLEFLPNKRGALNRARYKTVAYARGEQVIDGEAVVQLPHAVDLTTPVSIAA